MFEDLARPQETPVGAWELPQKGRGDGLGGCFAEFGPELGGQSPYLGTLHGPRRQLLGPGKSHKKAGGWFWGLFLPGLASNLVTMVGAKHGDWSGWGWLGLAASVTALAGAG